MYPIAINDQTTLYDQVDHDKYAFDTRAWRIVGSNFFTNQQALHKQKSQTNSIIECIHMYNTHNM